MATFLEWTGADVFEETGDGHCRAERQRRRRDRDFLGAAGDGAGTCDDVRAARRRCVRRADRQDQDRARRHRPRTGFGSAGSRSLFVGGSAVRVGAERTVETGKTMAARELEAAAGDIEYRDGVFTIGGTDRSIGLFELARRQPQQRIVLDTSEHRCRSDMAQRLPHLRSRGRPGNRARPRSSPTGRSTTSAASSIR